MKKSYFVLMFMLVSSYSYGGGSVGKIIEMSLASKVAATVRPGTTQFSISGGFENAPSSCDKTWAAIANEDTHLVSLLLMAKAQDLQIEVHLDSTNEYYSGRCLVSYIEQI